MQMLKLGGGYFASLPANNWSGHGFYQFTPELFYRTFSEENGFRVSKLLVAPACVGGRWLDRPACEVMDPKSLGWVVAKLLAGAAVQPFHEMRDTIVLRRARNTRAEAQPYIELWAGVSAIFPAHGEITIPEPIVPLT
jgi:hypothetical protein